MRTNQQPVALRSVIVPSADTKPLSWSDYRDALRRRWWLIAVITLSAAVITLAIALAQTPIYQAESRIQVSPDGGGSVFTQSGNGDAADSKRALETQAQVIESERVRTRVMKDLNTDGVIPPAADAVVLGDTNIIAVRVRSIDPPTAEILANEYVAAYIALRQEAAIDQLVGASAEIQAKIDEVQGQIDGLLPEDPQVDSLVSQLGAFRQALNQLQVETSVKSSGVAIVQQASTPTDPVAPRPVRDMLIAALIAFIASVLLVLFLERINRAVRSDTDLARFTDLPILADVPNSAPTDNRPVSLSAPSTGVAEAYRGLRSTFQYLGAHDGATTIVVTSAMTDEGKTTTAANLAVVLAQAGRKVVLVDADLRQPHQHDVFGTTVEPGLVDLLTWQHDTEALRRLDLGDGAELMLIPAGSVPLGSSELLGSERGVEVFNELRANFDHVIIDSAPVLPVADTMSLVAQADATVLVVRSTRTARTTVQTALRRLARIDATVAGFVLNRVPGRFMPGGHDRYGRYGLADLGVAPPILVEGPDASQFTDTTVTEVTTETDRYGNADVYTETTEYRAVGGDAAVTTTTEVAAGSFARVDPFAPSRDDDYDDVDDIDDIDDADDDIDTAGAADYDTGYRDGDLDDFDDDVDIDDASGAVDAGVTVDTGDDVDYQTGYATGYVAETDYLVETDDDGDDYDGYDDDLADDGDDDGDESTTEVPIVTNEGIGPIVADQKAVEQLVMEVMEDVYASDGRVIRPVDGDQNRTSETADDDEAEELWAPNDPNDFPTS